MLLHFLATLYVLLIRPAVANPAARYQLQPFPAGVLQGRQEYGSENASGSPTVDLGYSVYQGYTNTTSGCNVFKGIRFAQPPTGNLRFQAPRPPTLNRTATISATEYAPQCPQSGDASYSIKSTNETDASEDCLWLNVWAPNNATEALPVLVWIHGGGYGQGNGRQDLQPIINTNNNSFVGVTIQYRLGAFGFMSSDEIFRKGVVNAGILDQHFALHWVQEYIHLFNGDPNRVTIFGESAGAGSVMLQDMAYGGSLGSQLFQNSIAASPYLPMQYGYKDWIPTQSYYALASQVGCDTMLPYGANGTMQIFECLLDVSSERMINASANISQAGNYGTWAFLPVTDGIFVQDLPSRQLKAGKVNGINGLWGNNANEGPLFVPQQITTEDDLVSWLRLTFPLFNNNDVAKVLYYYPSSNMTDDPSTSKYQTFGNSTPTAVNESVVSTGQQERANLIYAETTFICPSYWLAEAYSDNEAGGQSYKYQFSIPPALHGEDVAAYFNWPGTAPFTVDFQTAFQRIIGNFITTSNPSISNTIANGVSISNSTMSNSSSSTQNPVSDWPPFSIYAPYQIDLNTTCGASATASQLQQFNITIPPCEGSSTPMNSISQLNAYTFQGGRGVRCDFWRAMGELVPE